MRDAHEWGTKMVLRVPLLPVRLNGDRQGRLHLGGLTMSGRNRTGYARFCRPPLYQ